MFHIQHYFLTPYYPQLNGQEKATNKMIEKVLQKTIKKYGKDQNTQIYYTFWDYHMSVHSTTCNTQYKLVYGINVVIPLELEIPSLLIYLNGIIDDNSYREQ